MTVEPSDFSAAKDCVSCGLCLPHCPTYREYPVEMASPRGRIELMKGLAEGELQPGPALEEHLSLCLGCRACETACPSDVRFGHLLENARAVLKDAGASGWTSSALRRLFLNQVFPRPAVLSALASSLRFYQTSMLRRWVQSLLRLMPGPVERLEALMPDFTAPWSAPPPELPAHGPERGVAAFLTGCVMPHCTGEANDATLEVLRHHGYRVLTPKDQRCCGALHLHSGYQEEARQLARANVSAFEATGADVVVTSSAGCGAALKEYGDLLSRDPEWAERSRAVESRVRDVHQVLAETDPPPPMGRIALRAVYDDPCHLLHGQGVSLEPRQLLRAVPGLELVEAKEPDWCCGSAGIYTVTHTEMSLRVLDRKMEDLLSLEPDIILTANPGCLLQLRLGVARSGSDVPVHHVMELLARASRGPDLTGPDELRRHGLTGERTR